MGAFPFDSGRGARRPADGDGAVYSLAVPVEGYGAGSLVQVTVCAPNHSRLVLDFGDDRVLTDACVLLCGHVGELKLLELGYTGPIIRRPRMRGDRVEVHGDLPGHA